MYNKDTKILITGGAGFIGTNFVSMLLDAGHNPDCISIIDNLSTGNYLKEVHDRIKFFHTMDIRSSAIIQIIDSIKPDFIFHFAGLVSIYDCDKNPQLAFDVNVLGSINVLEGAVKAGTKRVIFSESSAVYENSLLPWLGYNEWQSDPTTIYATTKASLALLAKSYNRTRNLNYTALRYFNVYGKLQDWTRTVPPASCGFGIRLMNGLSPIVFGDGHRKRDFIHVDDVNRFHMMCMTDSNTENQTYNLGTGKSISLYEMIDGIAKILDIKDYKVEHLPEINGEAFEIYADISKAKALGWEPQISFEAGHKDLILYLKSLYVAGKFPKNYMSNLDVNTVKIQDKK